MSRTISTIAVAALSVSLTAPLSYMQGTQAATPKIAYIKSEAIMEQIPASNRTELEAAIKKEMAPFEARLKAIEDSNKTMLDKFQAEQAALSADAKASRVKEIEAKQRTWLARRDTINAKAAQKTEEIQAPMMEALKKVIEDIRREDGYWMIVDVSNERGLIVAIDRNMEVTDRVITRFKTALASLPKPGAPGASGAPVNTGTGVGGVKIPPPPPGK